MMSLDGKMLRFAKTSPAAALPFLENLLPQPLKVSGDGAQMLRTQPRLGALEAEQQVVLASDEARQPGTELSLQNCLEPEGSRWNSDT